MSQLTVNQVATRAEILEKTITALIQQYEEETSTSVDTIDVSRYQLKTVSGEIKDLVSVRVNIDLKFRHHG